MTTLRDKPFAFEGRDYTTREFARAFELPASLVWLRVNHGILDWRLPLKVDLHIRRPWKRREVNCPRSPMYVATYFGLWKV